MKHLKLISLIAIVFTLASCAQMQQDFIAQNCNYNSAYEKGYNDGVASEKMNSSMYSANCPAESQQEALKGYREGYDKAVVTSNPTAAGTSIQIGGTQINIPGKVSNKAFLCRIEAFTEKFDAFGATKLEATMNVQAKCKQRYQAMHCEEVECVKNR